MKRKKFAGTLLWAGALAAGLGFLAPGSLNAAEPPSAQAEEKKEKCLAAEGVWSENFQEVSALAKETKRPILIYFTGSDWCGWCRKLHAEVLDRPDFKNWAKENVVLFKADFPRGIQQSSDLKKQNRELARRYKVSGFPTLVLADADGKVIADTGYQPGGAAAYVKHLESLLKK